MNKKCILILDDEPSQKLIRGALKDLRGVDFIVSDNIEDSLEILEKKSISLVLTDIIFKGKKDLDFVTTIRNSGIDTDVIFVSGQADKALAIKALRLKAFDFIEKPFDNKTLLDSVEKALASINSRFLPQLENLNLNLTQTRVLEMLMKGLSNKEIAKTVNLSEQGVKYHVGNLFKKFETSSRTTLRTKIRELIGV